MGGKACILVTTTLTRSYKVWFLAHGFRVVFVYCRRAGRIEQLWPWQQELSGCSHDSGREKGREKGRKTVSIRQAWQPKVSATFKIAPKFGVAEHSKYEPTGGHLRLKPSEWHYGEPLLWPRQSPRYLFKSGHSHVHDSHNFQKLNF